MILNSTVFSLTSQSFSKRKLRAAYSPSESIIQNMPNFQKPFSKIDLISYSAFMNFHTDYSRPMHRGRKGPFNTFSKNIISKRVSIDKN